MKKAEYMKPAMRMKPLATEKALMDFSVDPGTEVNDGLAKEMDLETDEYQFPQSNSVWGD